MRKFLTVAMMVMLSLFIGCNGYGCAIQPAAVRNGDSSFNGGHGKTEEVEKRLVEYISKRVVRVVMQCQVLDVESGKIVQEYKEAGWGTGAIIVSTDNYTLIQTAAHVIELKTTTSGDKVRTCDRFIIEQRDLNNKVIATYGNVGIVAKDDTRDIGVVRIPYNLGVSSKLADSVYIGQRIRILAYPWLRGIQKAHLSYASGYIATINLGRKNSLRKSPNQMRIDAFGFMGSSGGAVWTSDGKLVGIVTMLTGWRTFGGYIPQHSCLYGPSVEALKNFYREKGIKIVK